MAATASNKNPRKSVLSVLSACLKNEKNYPQHLPKKRNQTTHSQLSVLGIYLALQLEMPALRLRLQGK